MTADSNRAAIVHAYDALRTGNAAPFLDLLADDVEYTLYGDHPLARTYRGKREFLERMAVPLAERLEGPILLEVDRVLADGDHVVVEARGRARAKSGARYDQHYCVVFRMNGGRIVAGREYLDTALLAALVRGAG